MDTDTQNIQNAAQWLAVNGPGPKAFKECRTKFSLSMVELAKVCGMAANIRQSQPRKPT